MKKSLLYVLFLLVILGGISCKKETISNRNSLILGSWDCVDYANSGDGILKGKSPVFISNLYEKGYVFKKNNLMWTRNIGGDNKMFTDKRVKCEWMLSADNLSISLLFPDDYIETYEIIKLTRKELILKGQDGVWAGSENTYVFNKI